MLGFYQKGDSSVSDHLQEHPDVPKEKPPSRLNKTLGLSGSALFCSFFLPWLILAIGRFLPAAINDYLILLLLVSPIVGFFLGIIALTSNKKHAHRVAFILALLAIVIPLLYVGFVVLAFTVPGLINLM